MHVHESQPVRQMGGSSELTPLSTLCKQLRPINWIPLLLSLALQLSKASFFLRNLIYDYRLIKLSKMNICCAINS